MLSTMIKFPALHALHCICMHCKYKFDSTLPTAWQHHCDIESCLIWLNSVSTLNGIALVVFEKLSLESRSNADRPSTHAQ